MGQFWLFLHQNVRHIHIFYMRLIIKIMTFTQNSPVDPLKVEIEINVVKVEIEINVVKGIPHLLEAKIRICRLR